MGAYWGFIVGDALGVPYEFTTREDMKLKPATEMIGNGTHNQLAGTWSDDTSMMLCVLKNLNENGTPLSLAKLFIEWYQEGSFTPHGEVFDIGISTTNALEKIIQTNSIKDVGDNHKNSAGNGSLMRCLPYSFNEVYNEAMVQMLSESRMTHRLEVCHVSVIFYTKMAHTLYYEKCSLLDAFKRARGFIYFGWRITDAEDDHMAIYKLFEKVFTQDYTKTFECDVESTGYVIHTLEGVLWCLFNSNNYKEAVLKAVNLGGDTDTIAALTGGIAGLMYGYDSIPVEWIEKIANKELLNSIIK